jgi:hypothetical protein
MQHRACVRIPTVDAQAISQKSKNDLFIARFRCSEKLAFARRASGIVDLDHKFIA